MKDISAPSTRHSRHNIVYPKRRPSPHGVYKPHRTPSHGLTRRSPRSARSALIQQCQRDAALRREGLLFEEEYHDDIRLYMHEMERFTMCHMQSMDQQPEIRWHMRPCLVDFLVEVHFTFRLRPETLYLTLNIIDRYVSRRVVYTKHYQLVGCAALWIAAKFEDAKERVPTVQDLVQMCHDTYEESAFIQMEGHVLSTIQWSLGHPTAEAWLRLVCCGPCQEEAKVQHVARFLMEITLFYREFVNYPPSTIALAALTLARFLCGKPPRLWEETEECLEVVEFLDTRLSHHVNDLSETLIKKYSYPFYSKAATFVVQFYLEGGHFTHRASTTQIPSTPIRSASSSTASTPMSSTSMSDISDDFPSTPLSSFSPNDILVTGAFYVPDDKENIPSTFDPMLNKQKVEAPLPMEHYHSHDFVSFGRPALHHLNVSPRALVSQ